MELELSPLCPRPGDAMPQTPQVNFSIAITSDVEDKLEQAFWDFDAARKTKDERDSFKGVVRHLLKNL